MGVQAFVDALLVILWILARNGCFDAYNVANSLRNEAQEDHVVGLGDFERVRRGGQGREASHPEVTF